MYRHKRHRSKLRAAVGVALLAAVAIVAGLWTERSRFEMSKTLVSDTGTISQSAISQFGTGIAADSSSQPWTDDRVRRIFGHSLVPGGIRSIQELAIVTRRDPQLAEHYQGFDLSQGRVVTLDRDVLAFVSYRLDGAIYWEARPTLIARGERVLTDGTNFIRGRCGNRIVELPQFPISSAEPADMDIVVGELAEPADPPEVTPSPKVLDVPAGRQEAPGAGPGAVAGLPIVQMEPTPTWFVPPPIIGGPKPPHPPIPPSPPFGADEFSDVSLRILGHSRSVPTGFLTLLAGIALVTVVRLVLWRSL
jgi:hypothetical protein